MVASAREIGDRFRELVVTKLGWTPAGTSSSTFVDGFGNRVVVRCRTTGTDGREPRFTSKDISHPVDYLLAGHVDSAGAVLRAVIVPMGEVRALAPQARHLAWAKLAASPGTKDVTADLR